jgi:hypothetical protein
MAQAKVVLAMKLLWYVLGVLQLDLVDIQLICLCMQTMRNK